MENLPPEALLEVAAYFQVLSEPTRLNILNLLRDGERNVGELAQLCGFTAANISRHLTLLTKQGFVATFPDKWSAQQRNDRPSGTESEAIRRWLRSSGS